MKKVLIVQKEHTFCFKLTQKGIEILRFAEQHLSTTPGELILMRMMQDGNYHPLGDLEKKAKKDHYPTLNENNFSKCLFKLVAERAIEQLK